MSEDDLRQMLSQNIGFMKTTNSSIDLLHKLYQSSQADIKELRQRIEDLEKRKSRSWWPL